MNFSFFASYAALWGLVVFQGLLVLAVLRKVDELRRLKYRGDVSGDDWLPLGTQAPAFKGEDAESGDLVSGRIFDGGGGVILFLSPDCTTCKSLANNFRSGEIDLPTITAVCNGEASVCAGFRAVLGFDVQLLLDRTSEIRASYGVSGMPTAVIVDGNRSIRGYGHPQTVSDLKSLVEQAFGEASNSEGVGRAVEGSLNDSAPSGRIQ